MIRVLAVVFVLIGVGVAAPPLWFTHTLTLVPAVFAGACLSMGCYLASPDRFLAWLGAIESARSAMDKPPTPPAG